MTYDTTFSGTVLPGAHVFTLNGDDLGTVKEIQGAYFKVDAAMQPDYWLSNACIRSASAARVDLAVDKDHLGDAKVEDPTKR